MPHSIGEMFSLNKLQYIPEALAHTVTHFTTLWSVCRARPPHLPILASQHLCSSDTSTACVITWVILCQASKAFFPHVVFFFFFCKTYKQANRRGHCMQVVANFAAVASMIYKDCFLWSFRWPVHLLPEQFLTCLIRSNAFLEPASSQKVLAMHNLQHTRSAKLCWCLIHLSWPFLLAFLASKFCYLYPDMSTAFQANLEMLDSSKAFGPRRTFARKQQYTILVNSSSKNGATGQRYLQWFHTLLT